MKIFILLDEPWDSGITNYAIQTARILSDNNHDVTLGVRPGKKPEKLAKQINIKTVPVDSYRTLQKALSQSSYDVINPHTGKTHTWSVFSQIVGSNGSKKIPVIRTRGDAREVRTNMLFQFIYNRTQGVIAASDHVRKQYELGFNMSDEKLRTIYPSVSADDYVSKYPENRVGIIGRLDPVKGHAHFIEAAAKVLTTMPDVKFLIAGREANISYSILQNQANQLGIGHAIEFLGYQPSATEFMRSCTMGVISSIGSEEVSRACLEWMGVGRPVVGTLVGCLPELIEPRETGLLVPPAESGALGDAILSVLKLKSQIRNWGQQAHFIAQKRFNERLLNEKTIRMYQWTIDSLS